MIKKKTFEQALEELEGIVAELESGDLSLETALSKFEQGVKLSRFCGQKLDETEKKVSLLLKDENGQDMEVPFEKEDESPGDDI